MRYSYTVLVFFASYATQLTVEASLLTNDAHVGDPMITASSDRLAILRSKTLLAILSGAALKHRTAHLAGRNAFSSDWDPHMSARPSSASFDELSGAADYANDSDEERGRVWNIPNAGTPRHSTYKSSDVQFLRALSGDSVTTRKRLWREEHDVSDASTEVLVPEVPVGEIADIVDLGRRPDFARRVVFAALKYKMQSRVERSPLEDDDDHNAAGASGDQATAGILQAEPSPIYSSAVTIFPPPRDGLEDTCPRVGPRVGSLLRVVYNTWKNRIPVPST